MRSSTLVQMRYVSGMDTRSPPLPAAIYLIAAHPDWRASRVNRQLLAATRDLPHVEVQDLYSSYPDYAIDVPAEQARVATARLIVLMHPLQWYSMPALQKLWLDEVLSFGWAYGSEAGALRGKDLWLVTSTGGSEESFQVQSYNRHPFSAFLPPYEQTATLCGMRFLPPLVLYGAHAAGEPAIAAHARALREKLLSYPAWPELQALGECPACEVPPSDRPRPPAPSVKEAW